MARHRLYIGGIVMARHDDPTVALERCGIVEHRLDDAANVEPELCLRLLSQVRRTRLIRRNNAEKQGV
jgi:hypothetical protein